MDKIPAVNQDLINQIEEKLGKFQYDPNISYDETLPELGPYQIEKDFFYKGQFKNGLREGRGTQIWEDGSIYVGNWRNGMAFGKGRLIH